jgi:membrane-bound inhibitor of C-type lysozyme
MRTFAAILAALLPVFAWSTDTEAPAEGTKRGPVPLKAKVASSGAIAYDCTRASGGTEAVTATFWRTQPALVLVERGKETRPAFQVRSTGGGAKYEGNDLLFWDKRGTATATWSGTELQCKQR